MQRAPNFETENKLYKQGFDLIAGIDEAGRGSWAGPIVASAVIFKPIPPKPSVPLTAVNDSKKLNPKQRQDAYELIIKTAHSIGIGTVDVETIDKVGIGKANQLAMLLAILNLKTSPNYIITDFLRLSQQNLHFLNLLSPLNRYHTNNLQKLLTNQLNITFGDAICTSIAAASIIAKVHRDNLMINLHKDHPHYNFKKNKGYPSREHQETLRIHGPSPIHRKSFTPINQLKLGILPKRDTPDSGVSRLKCDKITV